MKEFAELPYPYSRYLISKDGMVWDTKDGRHLPHKCSEKSQYISVTTWRDDKPDHSVTSHLHRLLALGFKELPEGKKPEELQVNHIDGNKHNNSLENLEWTTQADNIRHAYRTGLQNHETPVEVVDKDGNIKRFRSQVAASEYLKISRPSLNTLLKSGIESHWYKGVYVRYADKKKDE